MSDTHVQADYLAGRLAFNLWTWTGEANKPSSGAIFGNSCGQRCFYITPLTGDAELNPPTLRDEHLAPLAVEPSNGQIPYYKAFIDTGFGPCWSAKVIRSSPPVLKCLI